MTVKEINKYLTKEEMANYFYRILSGEDKEKVMDEAALLALARKEYGMGIQYWRLKSDIKEK